MVVLNSVIVVMLVALLLSMTPVSPYETVLVDTSLGRVLGRKQGAVVSFLGIPFAEPPTGRNRFRWTLQLL